MKLTAAEIAKYCIAGLLLTAAGFVRLARTERPERAPAFVQEQSIPIPNTLPDFIGSLHSINNATSVQGEMLDALFIINATTCPACVFEILEYIDLLATTSPSDTIALAKNLDDLSVGAIIVADDHESALRFVLTSSLRINTYFSTADLIRSIIPDTLTTSRLWLVDRSRPASATQIILPSGATTSLAYKQQLLRRHFGSPVDGRHRPI